MNLIIDIDETLLITKKTKCESCGRPVYCGAVPVQSEIDILNDLYSKGHIIILFTGRNWDQYEITKQQLKDFGINHHELVMGKPQGIYIDRTESESSVFGTVKRFNLSTTIKYLIFPEVSK